MGELQSYTIDELVRLTGVSQRNIRMYIAMGLLRSVGRRGRRTRYGQEYVDRLNFIQRVKQLQDAGRLQHSTLDFLGSAFAHELTAEEVAEAAQSSTRMIELFERLQDKVAEARSRSRDASTRVRQSRDAGQPPAGPPVAAKGTAVDELHANLSAMRQRTLEELQELKALADEVAELRSALRNEMQELRQRLKKSGRSVK